MMLSRKRARESTRNDEGALPLEQHVDDADDKLSERAEKMKITVSMPWRKEARASTRGAIRR